MKNITSIVLGILTVGLVGVVLFHQPSVGKAEATFVCIANNAACSGTEDHSCCEGLSCQQGPGASFKCASAETTPSPSPSPSVTPSPEVTPEVTPTEAPSNPGNPGGPGDGLSDGRSDGRSSCPDCTKAPQGQVLGATTDFAGTGVADEMIMNVVGALGGLSTASGLVLASKKKFIK